MPRPASITATAPGKVILFGEHAINRGQAALSASVGLYATCRVRPGTERYRFAGGGHSQSATRAEIFACGQWIERCRASADFAGIQKKAVEDYFGPAKSILVSVFGDSLPRGLDVEWESALPVSSGLGSGGAAFTAFVAALTALLPDEAGLERRAEWAQRGDLVAHGGIASALDTQTSLLGGVIHYAGHGLADGVPCGPGLALVIGHSGVQAATGDVNSRVRRWLAQKPAARLAVFRGIGALTRAALPALAAGDWDTLGRLMTLNQLVLEKIGVSCPELESLIDAALDAGALGAKLSGSGGGGIMAALVRPETQAAVADAVRAAGGIVYTPEIGVAGVALRKEESLCPTVS